MVFAPDVLPYTYTFTDSRNSPFTSFYVGVKVNAVGGESQCGCTVAVGNLERRVLALAQAQASLQSVALWAQRTAVEGGGGGHVRDK